jgi:hypothetical protein
MSYFGRIRSIEKTVLLLLQQDVNLWILAKSGWKFVSCEKQPEVAELVFIKLPDSYIDAQNVEQATADSWRSAYIQLNLGLSKPYLAKLQSVISNSDIDMNIPTGVNIYPITSLKILTRELCRQDLEPVRDTLEALFEPWSSALMNLEYPYMQQASSIGISNGEL